MKSLKSVTRTKPLVYCLSLVPVSVTPPRRTNLDCQLFQYQRSLLALYCFDNEY